MSNPTIDPKKNLMDRKKREMLETLKKTAPLITWNILPVRGDENPNRLYIRGSFFHKSGKELAALHEIPETVFEKTFPSRDFAEDVASGFESDRQRKDKMDEV